MKKGQQAMLIRYAPQYWSIKKTTIKNTKVIHIVAKFDTQSLCQNNFFGMTLLHANAHSGTS